MKFYKVDLTQIFNLMQHLSEDNTAEKGFLFFCKKNEGFKSFLRTETIIGKSTSIQLPNEITVNMKNKGYLCFTFHTHPNLGVPTPSPVDLGISAGWEYDLAFICCKSDPKYSNNNLKSFDIQDFTHFFESIKSINPTKVVFELFGLGNFIYNKDDLLRMFENMEWTYRQFSGKYQDIQNFIDGDLLARAFLKEILTS